jgi:hypothetical protein
MNSEKTKINKRTNEEPENGIIELQKSSLIELILQKRLITSCSNLDKIKLSTDWEEIRMGSEE